MSTGTDSPDDRRAARRARRWRRRARIAAPFLAVPVVLGLLILSVDLIEYHPSARADRTGPRPTSAVAPRAAVPDHAMGLEAGSMPSVSVVESPLPTQSAMAAPSPMDGSIPGWPAGPSRSTAR